MPTSARTRKTPVAPLDLRPIKRALSALATLDDPDAVMPFVDYCEDLIVEVERLRALLKEKARR